MLKFYDVFRRHYLNTHYLLSPKFKGLPLRYSQGFLLYLFKLGHIVEVLLYLI